MSSIELLSGERHKCPAIIASKKPDRFEIIEYWYPISEVRDYDHSPHENALYLRTVIMIAVLTQSQSSHKKTIFLRTATMTAVLTKLRYFLVFIGL